MYILFSNQMITPKYPNKSVNQHYFFYGEQKFNFLKLIDLMFQTNNFVLFYWKQILPKMHVTEHNLHKGRTIASFYFFMQGLASLSPVNTIYSTLDFFIDRFPTADPSFTFPLANFTSNLLLIFGMVYIKKTFPLILSHGKMLVWKLFCPC